MVAKITSGASVYGALYYNYEKADKDKARILGWNHIMERSDGTVSLYVHRGRYFIRKVHCMKH